MSEKKDTKQIVTNITDTQWLQAQHQSSDFLHLPEITGVIIIFTTIDMVFSTLGTIIYLTVFTDTRSTFPQIHNLVRALIN